MGTTRDHDIDRASAFADLLRQCRHDEPGHPHVPDDTLELATALELALEENDAAPHQAPHDRIAVQSPDLD